MPVFRYGCSLFVDDIDRACRADALRCIASGLAVFAAAAQCLEPLFSEPPPSVGRSRVRTQKKSREGGSSGAAAG